MAKRQINPLVLLIFLIIFSAGCQTLKQALQGAKEGAKQDWQEIKKADDWLRKNLW